MTFFIASLLIYESSPFRPIRKQNLPKGFFSGPLGHSTAIRSIFYQEPPDLSKKKCEWVEASKKALELNDYGLKCCIPAEKCKNAPRLQEGSQYGTTPTKGAFWVLKSESILPNATLGKQRGKGSI